MLNTFSLPAEVIELDGPVPILPPNLEREVEKIWQEARAQSASRLFNGQIFSVDGPAGNPLRGRFIEYRQFYAQFRRPDLFPQLQVRALSVSALLVTREGVVWGQRGQTSAQKPGCWELIPCGAVDPTSRTTHKRLDLQRQIFGELREELGLEPADLTEAKPIDFFTDTTHQIHFYAFKLVTALSASEIQSAFKKGGPREHISMKIVPNSQLNSFLLSDARELGEVSRYLLVKAGLI